MAIAFRTTGTFSTFECLVRRTWTRRRIRLPATCAVIERPDGLVLIDTGWSRAQCAWPESNPGRVTKVLLGMDVRPEDALASQLIVMGYHPNDVLHIIATHLHVDHVGGAVDFPNATVHTTPAEWNARRLGRRKGYDPSTLTFTDRLQLHDLHDPPMLGFPRSHDLFGDGTIWLLDASGHTPGSVAVAVRLLDGWLVHAGDACMFREEYADPTYPGPSLYGYLFHHNRTLLQRTHGFLRTAERDHGAVVVPSHDPAVFATLPTTIEKGWRTAWDPAESQSVVLRTSKKPPTPPERPDGTTHDVPDQKASGA